MHERDALVAQVEVDLPGNVALVELLGLERLDLARTVFESLRDVGDRQLALDAHLSEHPPGSGPGGRRTEFGRFVHSNRPFCSSWYSFDPGKRRRSWLA